jgi:non-reducing end alpha-L-arabinofuranosidase
MKTQFTVLVVAIAAGMISGACTSGSNGLSGTGGSSSSGTGGSSSSGTGGSSSGGAPGGSCSDVSPCGGSLVGTWNVTTSCLTVTGNLDLSLVGAGCPSAPVTGSLQVIGTWTANGDGTYSDNTITSGQEQFTLGPSCLVISSTQTDCPGAASIIKTLGYSSLTCTSVTGGGCACSATVNQNGALGMVSVAPTNSGNYTPSGSQVTISGDVGDTQYDYCVSANTLKMTPQSTSPTMTGTIVLQKSGVTVTGGAGGATGTGGTSSAGGATGTGGASATGGSGGKGGDIGNGGHGGNAGLSGAGGIAGATGTGGSTSTGGTTGTGGSGAAGTSGTGGTSGTSTGPCDIYKSGGTPCVAAHSTVRALFGAYSGKLYQVRNTGGTTKDINAVTAGGVADAAAQDSFCSGTTCVITAVYDQTGNAHDLWYQGSGSPVGGKDQPASATGESIKVGGNKVYSLYIKPSNSYWHDGSKTGVPLGSAPEGMYMVTSGTHYNSGCCFDYGNSETGRAYVAGGHMDALNFSDTTAWGTGAGAGPWVMADLEAGLFSQGGSGKNNSDPTQTATFVTAVLKNNGTTEFALRGADATTGSLATYYKGALPAGWSPMKKEGAIVLGSGGDCCNTNNNLSQGTFYEGCLVSGYPSDATENSVQANIVAARYGQ